MCRIMCYITSKGHPHKKEIIQNALQRSDKNGGQSIGILTINPREKPKVYKLIQTGTQTAATLNPHILDAGIIIIHNRYATHGDVNTTNAHPISKKGIYVIHNGVINNHADITPHGPAVSETDTESILNLYLNTGRDAYTFHEHIHKLTGTRNFIIYDHPKKHLIIHRDNALEFSHSPTSSDTFITSDHKQLIGKTGDKTLTINAETTHDTLFGQYTTTRVIKETPYNTDYINLGVKDDYWLINTTNMNTIMHATPKKAPTPTYNTQNYRRAYHYDHPEYATRDAAREAQRDAIAQLQYEHTRLDADADLLQAQIDALNQHAHNDKITENANDSGITRGDT